MTFVDLFFSCFWLWVTKAQFKLQLVVETHLCVHGARVFEKEKPGVCSSSSDAHCRPRHSDDRREKKVGWILMANLCVCQSACVSSVHPAAHMVFHKSW